MASSHVPHVPAELAQKATTYSEPLLKDGVDRFVMFPLQYPELWRMYKVAQASVWTAEEIDLRIDVLHWDAELTEDERKFISKILSFFAASDGIVVENLAQRFCAEVTAPEARSFYSWQMAMETVHGETYSLLLSTFIKDPDACKKLFAGIETIPTVKAKAQWAMRWTADETQPFSTRIVAFAAVEGIFFSASFAAIFWLRSRGLMPGLCQSNDLISRDEALHTTFACTLHAHLSIPCPVDVVHTLVREAVELEKAFFRDALPLPLCGMNAETMDEYVELVGDHLLKQLGYPALYNASNPFPFMDLILLDGKNNFFERRVSEYHHPHVAFEDHMQYGKANSGGTLL
ncbi:putative ribonucleoside-diphosphate reductase small chain B [Panus rudis PR-1116 ss-1]|nr:putative ribonucleoside-diphosphate reductase small chain B [Panus rudis PR-1116 ss-1]